MTLNSTDATHIGGEFRSSFAAGQEPKKTAEQNGFA